MLRMIMIIANFSFKILQLHSQMVLVKEIITTTGRMEIKIILIENIIIIVIIITKEEFFTQMKFAEFSSICIMSEKFLFEKIFQQQMPSSNTKLLKLLKVLQLKPSAQCLSVL